MPVHFHNFDAVLIDLDGTLLRHEQPLPGAGEFAAAVARASAASAMRYAVLTNSTAGPNRIARRMASAGLGIDPGHVYTAAAAACDHVVHTLGRPDGRPARVFNLATPDVYELLDGRAAFVGDGADAAGACDAVIVGNPTNEHATPDRQRRALALLRGGAALVATSADRVFPSGRGIEFGSGALAAMLAYAAGVRPQFCGKPQAAFFLELCRRLNARPERCLLVGDNLEADVVGAKALGMRTVLMLTGVTSERELAAAPPAMRPDAVARDLRELLI